MVGKKQVNKPDRREISKKASFTLSIEDRLQAFANIIVERILEDKRQGILRYRVDQNG